MGRRCAWLPRPRCWVAATRHEGAEGEGPGARLGPRPHVPTPWGPLAEGPHWSCVSMFSEECHTKVKNKILKPNELREKRVRGWK